MAVQMARDTLQIVSPIYGQIQIGAVLLVLDGLNIVRLFSLKPFNVHLKNRMQMASTGFSSAQTAVFFVAPAANVPFGVVLLIQVLLLLLLCGLSHVVSRIELRDARYIVVYGGPPPLPRRERPTSCGSFALPWRAWKQLSAWWSGSRGHAVRQSAPAPAHPHRHAGCFAWPRSSRSARGSPREQRLGWRPARAWLRGLRKRAGGVVEWLRRLPKVVGRLVRELLNTVFAEMELPEPLARGGWPIVVVSPGPPPQQQGGGPQQIEVEQRPEPMRSSSAAPARPQRSSGSFCTKEPDADGVAAAGSAPLTVMLDIPLSCSSSIISPSSIQLDVVHGDDVEADQLPGGGSRGDGEFNEPSPEAPQNNSSSPVPDVPPIHQPLPQPWRGAWHVPAPSLARAHRPARH
jgi:hypothetical protein